MLDEYFVWMSKRLFGTGGGGVVEKGAY